MKKLLVRFNRQLLIDVGDIEQPKLQPIYGILAPYYEDDEEMAKIELDLIDTYTDYLAAMHLWSIPGREKEFSVSSDNLWIDIEGEVHTSFDEWAGEIGRKCRKELNLDYSLDVIDLDGIEKDCLECGTDGSFIICETLMEGLNRLVEQQAEDQYNVILFNRPLWLPNCILCEGEDGFSHIYGLLIDQEIDRRLLQDCNLYLGYLAMVEELILNDMTPSGYTADLEKDGCHWYDRGKEYTCTSPKMRRESHLCRRKLNLKLHDATVKLPRKYIKNGTWEGFIISLELYEYLVRIIANADGKSGCQK